jgi:hypothetical protein
MGPSKLDPDWSQYITNIRHTGIGAAALKNFIAHFVPYQQSKSDVYADGLKGGMQTDCACWKDRSAPEQVACHWDCQQVRFGVKERKIERIQFGRRAPALLELLAPVETLIKKKPNLLAIARRADAYSCETAVLPERVGGTPR